MIPEKVHFLTNTTSLQKAGYGPDGGSVCRMHALTQVTVLYIINYTDIMRVSSSTFQWLRQERPDLLRVRNSCRRYPHLASSLQEWLINLVPASVQLGKCPLIVTAWFAIDTRDRVEDEFPTSKLFFIMQEGIGSCNNGSQSTSSTDDVVHVDLHFGQSYVIRWV